MFSPLSLSLPFIQIKAVAQKRHSFLWQHWVTNALHAPEMLWLEITNALHVPEMLWLEITMKVEKH